MDAPPIKKQRRRRLSRSNATYPTLFLPDELIVEILSSLRVKNIVRLKCLSKPWNALISDPSFIEKHLKKSSRNPHLTLFWNQRKEGVNVLPFPVHGLLKNQSINVYSHNFHRFNEHCTIVGSCNGLLCLLFTYPTPYPSYLLKYWLLFWNPATGTRSKKFELTRPDSSHFYYPKLAFGYDASTRTYKVVAIRVDEASWKSAVKVFSLGNNSWRNIQSFNTVPVKWFDIHYRFHDYNDGVHLNGTVNWLTRKSIDQFSIVSLDLSTETYKQFLLPSDFNGVPSIRQPDLRVLMDSLCFSHVSNKTEFVLWHMKEYGVQESWTQLFKISYQNLETHNTHGGNRLACIYVNGDMVIFANDFRNRAFIYNVKDKTVEKIDTKKNSIQWFGEAKDYVESLVSVH